jgi:hypothetical protein
LSASPPRSAWPHRPGADPGSDNSGPDASFLAALDTAGITYQNKAAAVAVGKEACELMDRGDPEPDVVKQVSASHLNFTPSAATSFTVIAASAYCRRQLGNLTVLQAPPPPPKPLIEFPVITPGAG